MRDGYEDGGVGGKRKAGYDVDGLGSDGGLRETRRMRTRRLVQNGELISQLSSSVTGDGTGTLEQDNVRPQKSETVGCGFVVCFFTRTDNH